jgi:hypothetical protein
VLPMVQCNTYWTNPRRLASASMASIIRSTSTVVRSRILRTGSPPTSSMSSNAINRTSELVIKLRSRPERERITISCLVRSDGRIGNTKEASASDASSRTHNSGTDRSEHFVLVRVAPHIESPQNLIPSLVRLEASKKRVNFLRYILGASLDGVFQSSVFGEGEVGVHGFVVAGSSEGVTSVAICRNLMPPWCG